MSLINIPLDELRPEYVPLPAAWYEGDFRGAEARANSDGWEGISLAFNNLANGDGATTVTATGRTGRTFEIDLATRTKSHTVTVSPMPEWPDLEKRNRRVLGQFAVALGFVMDGHATVPGDTAAEVVEALNERAGTRLRFRITNYDKKDKATGEVIETRDDIVAFRALTDIAPAR